MKVRRKDAVVHEVAETGETVLCDVSGSRLLVLNDVGAAVWYLLDGERTIEAIVDEITGTLAADPARVRADVDAFLASLEAEGLIERLP